MVQSFLLQREQWVPSPIEEVFAFFADAKNLETITPPWLGFRILTPGPIAMQTGTCIAYRIRWRGLPLRWVTEIANWGPPFQFVDVQRRGPYALWHHTHTFEPRDGGTQVRDLVRYALPMGLLGPLLHRLVIRRDLEAIFDYRTARVIEIFGNSRPAATGLLPSAQRT
jgi:ligand-binding SRPBCC domain-containing protein